MIRSLKTLNELKERGLLSDDIEQIQIIKTKHKLNKVTDRYGYIVQTIKPQNDI